MLATELEATVCLGRDLPKHLLGGLRRSIVARPAGPVIATTFKGTIFDSYEGKSGTPTSQCGDPP